MPGSYMSSFSLKAAEDRVTGFRNPERVWFYYSCQAVVGEGKHFSVANSVNDDVNHGVISLHG